MNTRDHLIKITRQLYPTGRAFRMANDSYLHGLHRALGISEAQLYDDAVSTMDSLIPDTPRFTTSDAALWERCLGLTTNLTVDLEDRKAAILRKMAAPGTQRPKGHYLYLEQQLQAANFDVYVHENLLPLYPEGYESVAPNLHYGTDNLLTVRFGAFQYGQRRFGSYWNNKIVNDLDQDRDNSFAVGNSLACTFFIGGQALGTYANVDADREREFRKLILSLKQTQAVGFLFIHYT